MDESTLLNYLYLLNAMLEFPPLHPEALSLFLAPVLGLGNAVIFVTGRLQV